MNIDRIDSRVDEISEILDICGDSDSDVVLNLEMELKSYIHELEQSLRTLQRQRMRIVK